MQFEQDWDSYMLSYLTKIQNEGSPSHSPPIITCYPRGFDIVDFDNKNFYLQSDDTSTFTLNFREDSIFCNGPYSAQITSMTNIEITHGYLIAAGCLFTTGEFVKQVPYDQSLYFYGEELSIALRAFTKGFGIYHIPEVPIYHLYTDTSDLKRKLHWDEKEDSSRSVKWHERESISINRLIDLINHKVKGAYGLGNIRTLEDFEYISGINLKEQKVVDSEKAFTSEFLSSLSWKNEIFS
jgi:GT2 family glycosyltransferase